MNWLNGLQMQCAVRGVFRENKKEPSEPSVKGKGEKVGLEEPEARLRRKTDMLKQMMWL
jgi:hypothetical protein